MIKKILLALLLVIFTIQLIGCQTVQGVGGDIRWMGGARDNSDSSDK